MDCICGSETETMVETEDQNNLQAPADEATAAIRMQALQRKRSATAHVEAKRHRRAEENKAATRMQAQHRKRSAKAHVEEKRTGRPALGRCASSDKLGRADRLVLAHFRRQLATGLLLQRHLTPGEPRTQACVFYTTPEFDALWWFESLMVGQKLEVAFEDIVEVGVGPPKSAHAVDNAIAKFKKSAKHADDGDNHQHREFCHG